MDGVLEGAAVLYVCKVACSVLFLPTVSACRSSVSFCCCCLLLFTDLAVTIFLVVLWLAGPSLPPPFSSGDAIALRFLLFLGNTYGAVLGMTPPLVGMEILTGLDVIGGGEEEEEDEAEKRPEKTSPDAVAVAVEETAGAGGGCTGDQGRGGETRPAPLPGFLCCLLVWVVSGLHGSLARGHRAEEEERWARSCLRTTGSLHRCLPSLLVPTPPGLREPCWGLLSLALLLALASGWGLLLRLRLRRRATPTDCRPGTAAKEGDQLVQSQRFPPPSEANLGLSPSLVDPEKTASGRLSVLGASRPRDQVQLCPRPHGNPNVPECLSADGGQKGGGPDSAVAEERARSPPWWRWGRGHHGGFPCLRVGVAAGLLLSLAALPLNLSVNVPLVCGVEALLAWSARPLLAAPGRKDAQLTGACHST